MKDLFSIEGKIALVTGSTGALGMAFTKGLAQQGATVILNGRNKKKLDGKVVELQNDGFKAFAYVFDVTNGALVNKAVQDIEREIGPIDILVNNAGIQVRAPLDEFKDEDWQNIIAVNLTGAYIVAKAVVQSMIKRRSGKIINIGSVQNELGRPNIAPYAASKGGLKMLTKGMAVDWAKYNIQVNGIGPGYFKTEMTKALYENPEFDAWLRGRTPSNRWGNPDELIGALIFLASDASSYVNGHMIYVDGGLLASV
ncbi:MAG: SDR family oxidoreductase [Bacteroidia bacterium]|nr:MAG: SDR family oxidoreductase [Bacteroidia bacterium]